MIFFGSKFYWGWRTTFIFKKKKKKIKSPKKFCARGGSPVFGCLSDDLQNQTFAPDQSIFSVTLKIYTRATQTLFYPVKRHCLFCAYKVPVVKNTASTFTLCHHTKYP